MTKKIIKFPDHTVVLKDDQAEKLLLRLSLPAELIFFQGHFPEKAILPAVSQIYMAEQLFKRYFSLELNFVSMKQLKFRRPIVPVKDMQLELTFNRQKSLLSFRYFDELELKSKGSILYQQAL